MSGYRDKTFCESDCTNKDCDRYISEAVERGAEYLKLPIWVQNFSQYCEDYIKPKENK